MIEKMKRVSMVSTAASKEDMLKALRDFGVVHLADRQAPERAATDKFIEMSKVSGVLKEYVQPDAPKEPVLSDSEFDAVYSAITANIDSRANAIQSKNSATAEIDKLLSWGDFSPQQVRELRDRGIDLHFYRLGKKECRQLLEDEDAKIIRLSDVDKMPTIASIGPIPEGITATEFLMPEQGISELKARIAECDEVIKNCDEDLKKASVYADSFDVQMLKAQNDEIFSSAEQTSGGDEDFVWISGYIPEEDMERFRTFAAANNLAWAADDPAEDDEQIPTKVKYSRATRIIKPLFDILGILPGYKEQDVSMWFLIFFTIFTAMIIGDAAYGVIFMIVAIVMTVKTKKVSDANFLIYVLAGATIVWGAITGTWFGSEAAMKVPLLKALVVPNFANYPQYFGVAASTQQNTIMKFSFTLGVAQLALGCLLSARKKIKEKNLSFIADIGWLIASSAMYLLSLYLVIGQKINIKPVFIAIGVAFVIVVLFGGMEPGKSFGQGIKAGLSGTFTVFLDTISCFGNVMSYIRLFAVGMASLAIAQSFNSIAAGMKGPLIVAAVVVLLIGHGLNLIMGLLSVVVHGVRLNVLEFSGQAGLEWTGVAYKPFKENDKIEN